MIIITNYRLEGQGEFLFREDKRSGVLPDLRREADGAWRASANSDRK